MSGRGIKSAVATLALQRVLRFGPIGWAAAGGYALWRLNRDRKKSREEMAKG